MQVGDWLEVEIFKIAIFGAFVKLPGQKKGLVHISQLSDKYVKDINEHFKVGDKVQAKIVKIAQDGKIDLTLRKEPDRPKFRKKYPAAAAKISSSVNKNSGGFKILPFEDKFDGLFEKLQLETAETPE
ncbi:MAG: S1 RNA-binding domain-containing protein [Candidatus Omnitrophica bacterium]|nr:S1 RNA-binding domain-containing protein [Candidatus Omnitrophota bacterium]